MFRKLLVFLAILIFSIPLWADSKVKKIIKESTLIVQNPEVLEKDYLVLENFWDYIENEFVEPTEFYPENKSSENLITLPHCFTDEIHYATYHCRIEGLLPNKYYGTSIYSRILSCCRIWCNDQLVGISGLLDKYKKSAKPAQNSSIIDLPTDENGILDIVIHVADFELRKGGIVKPLVITEKDNLKQRYSRLIFFSVMVIAFLMTLIIYNLILMIMNRKPIVYFSLVVVCAFFILSVATSGISIFNLLFPNVPFWIEFRLPVLFLSVDICTYIFYMGVSRRISGKHSIVLYAITVIVAIITSLIPIRIFERYRTVFIFIPLSVLAIILLLSFRFLLKKNLKTPNLFSFDTLLYNFDMLVNTGILVAFFYDFIISQNKNSLIYSCVAFKLGILLFGVMQCAIPAFRRYFTNYRIQQSSERFELNNNLLAKFIPNHVLKFMDAEDVTKIISGTAHIIDSMIVYTEIRYFKQLAESIEQKELFEIITEYYREIVPIIRGSGGYIAKYMYHGCLAIFPERNDATIRCAMKMQEKMNDVRRNLRQIHKADISIGIAIHTGKIACGVIGSEKRVDSVTYSPEVQTAINIGMQTSKTNTKIFISEDAMTYCRTYTECMYEGHFILVDGKNILVYSALPFKDFNSIYDGTLESVDEIEEMEEVKTNEINEA